jgi:hypothetical protein
VRGGEEEGRAESEVTPIRVWVGVEGRERRAESGEAAA